MTRKTVLVTGSAGYLGSQTVAALAQRSDLQVVALDVRQSASRLPGVVYEVADIRASEVDAIIARHAPRSPLWRASRSSRSRSSARARRLRTVDAGTPCVSPTSFGVRPSK